MPKVFTSEETEKLLTAMDWVIPPDTSPGAGTEACLAHLEALILSLPGEVLTRYQSGLASLAEADLGDKANPFAQEFLTHVRDCYYSYENTGAWHDIGFAVTG